MTPYVLPLALLAATLALPAAAERLDREKEIVIGADHSLADDANKVVTLQGNVVVTQGSRRITAAKMTVKEDAKGNRFYVANGAPVTFRQKREKVDEWVEGFAERAEFDDRNEILKLYNKARVKTGDNEVTGDFISYDMGRELAEVAGAPPGTTAPPNSRVKMVIVPQKKPGPGEEKAPAAPPLELRRDPGKQ
jgi:lipopolysaccharide export system protein LptA